MRTWKENVPSWSNVGQIKCEEVKTTYEEDDDSIIFHNPELGKNINLVVYLPEEHFNSLMISL